MRLRVSRSGPRLFVTATLALFFGACLDLFESADERKNNAGLDASSVDGSDAWPGSGGTGATGGAKESGSGGSGDVTGGGTAGGGGAGDGGTGGSSCVSPSGACSDVSQCCQPADSLCVATCCRQRGGLCGATSDCCDLSLVCGQSPTLETRCCGPLGATCGVGPSDCCGLTWCDPQKLKCCTNGGPCTNEDQCCTGFVCTVPSGKSATECCQTAGGDCSTANFCCSGACNPSTKTCD